MCIRDSKWTDRDGNEKYTTEVVLQGFGGTLTMLDGRNDGGGNRVGGGGYNQDSGGYGNQGNQGSQGQSRSASAQEGPAENFDLDDEIPF